MREEKRIARKKWGKSMDLENGKRATTMGGETSSDDDSEFDDERSAVGGTEGITEKKARNALSE